MHTEKKFVEKPPITLYLLIVNGGVKTTAGKGGWGLHCSNERFYGALEVSRMS